jgi:hypothetical protein
MQAQICRLKSLVLGSETQAEHHESRTPASLNGLISMIVTAKIAFSSIRRYMLA